MRPSTCFDGDFVVRLTCRGEKQAHIPLNARLTHWRMHYRAPFMGGGREICELSTDLDSYGDWTDN